MKELREIVGDIHGPNDPVPTDWDIAKQAIFNVVMDLTDDTTFNVLVRDSEDDKPIAAYVNDWLDRLPKESDAA